MVIWELVQDEGNPLYTRLGGPLPGKRTLPELLCDHRAEYVHALQVADRSHLAGKPIDLQPLSKIISHLLARQIAST
ncbi:hypothetical protein CEG14_05485 [Bordetella genomosp. 1]|uniref:Uncharacterized protein n=1 Tax=Bordetella genomosp. 1 TaxID=1395607 RepID=A0A261SNN1_9BORD|nr:hypothetical protein [Bordetella genomosp. 1]OZI38989.1 hypothetical protein CEG14_05485 [Bordetella genomosp. 1]OZI65270.1 hypothetical protein CAL27_09475 [Bordetella genomosp. 1]